MSAVCVQESSKRAPPFGPAKPSLYHDSDLIGPTPRPGAGGHLDQHDDQQLRNRGIKINYQHSSTPYYSQQQQQDDDANSTPTAGAIRSTRRPEGSPSFPSPPSALDHELDLTPRLLLSNCQHPKRPSLAGRLDECPTSQSSFNTRPAAVYEQPALDKHQLLSRAHLFKPLPEPDAHDNWSTFKRNQGTTGFRMSGDTQRRKSSTATARADCNSLDSFQSRSSASSSLASPSPTVATCQPLHRQTSVLIGTRYVRPPTVPPADTTVTQDEEEWREVPLAGDHPRVPETKIRAGRKRSSLFGWTCASTNARAHKSGIGGQKSHEPVAAAVKSPVAGKSPAIAIDPDSHRVSQAKVSSGMGKAKDEDHESRRRRDSSSSSAASNQPAGQIGKSRAPFLFAGILGSILASLFFSLGLLTIKLLPDGQGLAEKTKIVCFRGVAMMILCAATIIYQKSTFIVRRDELLVNVLRSILGFTGIFGAYIALKYISMGDSTALVFSSPVWTSLLSHFILNEPLQWIQLIALPLSILGIVLIAHPSLLINMEHQAGFSERQPLIEVVEEVVDVAQLQNTSSNLLMSALNKLQNSTTPATLNQDLDIALNTSEHFDYEHRWKGILIALGTSFIVSFVYIVLKFRKTTPIQTTTFWLGFATFSGALALMSVVGFGSWPRGLIEWTLLIFNGVCSWLGQCLLQWALKYEDASVLSVVRTLDVAMTFTLSALFLEEEILWTSILGAAIIAAVVVSIMLNNYISTRLCPPRPRATPAAPGDDGPSLRSSVTLSTGEPSGEPLDDDQVMAAATTSGGHRHASLAA